MLCIRFLVEHDDKARLWPRYDGAAPGNGTHDSRLIGAAKRIVHIKVADVASSTLAVNTRRIVIRNQRVAGSVA